MRIRSWMWYFVLMLGCLIFFSAGRAEADEKNKGHEEVIETEEALKPVYGSSGDSISRNSSYNFKKLSARLPEEAGLLRLNGTVISMEGDVNVGDEVSAIVNGPLNRKVNLVAQNGSIYEYTCADLGLTWVNPEIGPMIEHYASSGGDQLPLLDPAFQAVYDVNPVPLSAIVNGLKAVLDIAPVNGYVFKNGDHIEVTQGQNGLSYQAEQAVQEIAALMLSSSDPELWYQLPYTYPAAAISPENMSFPSLLGEYTTYDLGNPGRVRNIEVSSAGVDGTLVMPGESLSALAMYGDVIPENGYEVAPVYNTGRQIPGIGGGICQTTTTLYNACLRAELTIARRNQHSMLVTYVPPSYDAMVDYGSRSDFVAVNSTGYPIYLEASTGVTTEGRSYVNMRVWGTETRPENRYVDYGYEVLSVVFPEPLISNYVTDDTVCEYGLTSPSNKFTMDVEVHPFVQSRAIKTVYIDGVVQSREVLPGGYGGYDQYRAMCGVIVHASDCYVDCYVVEDTSTYLGKRVHYVVRFLNGYEWDPNNPNGYY